MLYVVVRLSHVKCTFPLEFPAGTMPAFRQVGEKQLPNPVLCMAWSPKRDLIALANTSGEVGLMSSSLERMSSLLVV